MKGKKNQLKSENIFNLSLHYSIIIIMQITPELFDKALLKPGREKFVELFLERETILLHEYINYKKLLDLFNNVANPDFFCQICLEGVLAKSPVSTVHILGYYWTLTLVNNSDQGHFFTLNQVKVSPKNFLKPFVIIEVHQPFYKDTVKLV